MYTSVHRKWTILSLSFLLPSSPPLSHIIPLLTIITSVFLDQQGMWWSCAFASELRMNPWTCMWLGLSRSVSPGTGQDHASSSGPGWSTSGQCVGLFVWLNLSWLWAESCLEPGAVHHYCNFSCWCNSSWLVDWNCDIWLYKNNLLIIFYFSAGPTHITWILFLSFSNPWKNHFSIFVASVKVYFLLL